MVYLALRTATAGSAVEGDLMGLLLLEIELKFREALLILINVKCLLIEINQLVQVPVILRGVGGRAIAVVCHLNN